MIAGRFGDEDELFFEVELIADNGLEWPVDALLDTDFSGWLAMDSQDLEGLDWIYIRRQKMRTAKGEFNFDIYAGKVRIDEQEFDIPVHVGGRSTGNFNRSPVAEKSAVSSWYVCGYFDIGS